MFPVVVLVPYTIFNIFIRQEFWKTFGVKDYLLNQNNFCLNTLDHFPHTLFFPNRANHDLLPRLWRDWQKQCSKAGLDSGMFIVHNKAFFDKYLKSAFFVLENQFFNP